MLKQIYDSTFQPTLRSAEILRYLGYGATEPTPEIQHLIDTIQSAMLPQMTFRACYDRLPLSVTETGRLDLGFAHVYSASLKKNLAQCDAIYILVATLGASVDRLIQKYSVLSPGSALVAQAIGTVAIEAWCDHLWHRLALEEASNQRWLRPRFSPGYGDFPLSIQRELLSYLDCSRQIGVTLNDSLSMSPSKSVSAIIGIGKEPLSCSVTGCEACTHPCIYRRS